MQALCTTFAANKCPHFPWELGCDAGSLTVNVWDWDKIAHEEIPSLRFFFGFFFGEGGTNPKKNALCHEEEEASEVSTAALDIQDGYRSSPRHPE